MSEITVNIKYELPFWLGLNEGKYEIAFSENVDGTVFTINVHNHLWAIILKDNAGNLGQALVEEKDIIDFDEGKPRKVLKSHLKENLEHSVGKGFDDYIYDCKKVKTFIEWQHQFQEENADDTVFLEKIEKIFLSIINRLIDVYRTHVDFNYTTRNINRFDLYSFNTIFLSEIFQDGVSCGSLISKIIEFPFFQNTKIYPEGIEEIRDVLKTGKRQEPEWLLYRDICNDVYFGNSRSFCIDVIHLIDILSEKIVNKSGRIDPNWIPIVMQRINLSYFIKKFLPEILLREMGKTKDFFREKVKALNEINEKRNSYIHDLVTDDFSTEDLQKIKETIDPLILDLFDYIDIPLPKIQSMQLPVAISLETSKPNQPVHLRLINSITEFAIKEDISMQQLVEMTKIPRRDKEIIWQVDEINFNKIIMKKIDASLYFVISCFNSECSNISMAIIELEKKRDEDTSFFNNITNIIGRILVASESEIEQGELETIFSQFLEWFKTVSNDLSVEYHTITPPSITYK